MKIIELFESKKELKTLYCSRKLLNGEDILKWAETQGFDACLDPKKMHVTIAYSKKKIDQSELTDSFDSIECKVNTDHPEKTKREVKEFDGGAIVLTFKSGELEDRWSEFCDDFGASWDHDGYHPHVTITYNGLPKGLKIEDIEPYEGVLKFGPETIDEIKKGWGKSAKEVKLDESELFYLQPDGQWKRGADGRSKGRTEAEVAEITEQDGPVDVTETRPFKQWFKNSKVVGPDGKPLVVYHGTGSNFRAFNIKKGNQPIIWFTSNKAEIESGNVGAQGKGKILELYASIQNPADWKVYDQLSLGEFSGRGYDGAILKEGEHFTGFVFEPTQLKSATKNNGNYDAHNKNLNEDAGRASFILDPALDPKNYAITDNIGDHDSWRVKTYLNNNDMDETPVGAMSEVGYIMVSKTRNTIIPISRGDEHHQGMDLLYDMRDDMGLKVDPTDYVPVFYANNYIYSKNDAPTWVNVLAKFLSYGGPNGVLKGTSEMSGMAMTSRQFVNAKGVTEVKPGTLAPIGASIVAAYQALADALSRYRANPEQKSNTGAAFKAAGDVLKLYKQVDHLMMYDIKIADLDAAITKTRELSKDGNVGSLEKMFFGYPSIKNDIHSNLKKYAAKLAKGQDDYGYGDRAKGIWGDIKLAIDMLGRF